jgi:hypothetical protein
LDVLGVGQYVDSCRRRLDENASQRIRFRGQSLAQALREDPIDLGQHRVR